MMKSFQDRITSNQYLVLVILLGIMFIQADIQTAYGGEIPSPDDLEILPAADFEPSGLTGGPFTPSYIDYTLKNTGNQTYTWVFEKLNNSDWFNIDLAWIELAPDQTGTVRVGLSIEADALGGDIYQDTVIFKNIQTNTTQIRNVTLNVLSDIGILEVTPLDNFASTGEQGGPFAPLYKDYQVANISGGSFYCGVLKTDNWLSITPSFVALGPYESEIISISLNSQANDLGIGVFNNTVTFKNLNSGVEHTRDFTLTVNPPVGILEVNPEEIFRTFIGINEPFSPSSQSYFLSNTGRGALDWIASESISWLDIDITNGTLDPNENDEVIATINSAATLMDPGIYHGTITFENISTGAVLVRQVILEIGLPRIFFDDFPSTILNSALWTNFSSEPTIDDVGINEPSEPYSLRLNGNPGGIEYIESKVINMAFYSHAEISYWYQRTGGGEDPDSGEDLVVQFWDGASWQNLALHPGDGPDMTDYLNEVISLPPAAFHADFQLRILKKSGSSGDLDDWFVDDIKITGSIPDVLFIETDADFTSSGLKGGPFTPSNTSYTIQNLGSTPIDWVADCDALWIDFSPAFGTLVPNEKITLNLNINSQADLLDSRHHNGALTIQNLNSGYIQTRSVKLIVLPPDQFTELFDNGNIDLGNLTLTFIPDQSNAFYKVCREFVTDFPTDPNGGTLLTLADDDYQEIVFDHGSRVSLHGQSYDRFFIGSNGYLTFGQGDIHYNASLENHFMMPRISALFSDLTPTGSISYKQFHDRIAVTYRGVEEFNDKNALSNFQIEMYFSGGFIRITWLDLDITRAIVGLSAGNGVPLGLELSDISEYDIYCCPTGDFNGDSTVNMIDFATMWANWLRMDCDFPDWCENTDINRNYIVNMADYAYMAQNLHVTLKTPDPPMIYQWTPPVFMPELNGTVGGDARHPHVSRDGLTMYLGRKTSGGQWEMVEAYRNDPDGPFTSERILTELPGAAGPWVSPDELRMYYGIADPAGGSEMKLATRISKADPWVTIRSLSEINYPGRDDGGPTLTDDQLTIFWSSAREPGDIWDYSIYCADRATTNDLFSNVRKVSELKIGYKCGSPSLTPDGLSIYFAVGILDLEPFAIYHARRASLNDPFGSIVELDIKNIITGHHPHITSDEKTLYLFADDGIQKGIWVSRNIPVSQNDFGSIITLPDMVAEWKLDDAAGASASETNGNYPGIVNGALWTTGEIAGGLLFNGASDFVDIGDHSSLEGFDQISIAAWINWQGPSTEYNACIAGKEFAYKIDVNATTNQIRFLTRTNDSWEPSILTSSQTIDLNTWCHVVATYDGSTKRIYINGQLDSNTYATSGAVGPYDRKVSIGAYDFFHTGWRGHFKGKIDEVSFYDRALSTNEILMLFQQELSPVSYWNFNENAGSVVYDSFDTNNGSINGSSWIDGISGSALSFDGLKDYVDLGNNSSLKPPLPLSFSAWVKLNSTIGSQIIIATDDSTGIYYGSWFMIGSLNRGSVLNITYGDGGIAGRINRRTKYGVTQLNAQTWYHVAAVIRGPTDMDIYINGINDGGTYDGSGGNLVYSSSGESSIGSKSGKSIFFNGLIDEPMFFNQALSAENVKYLYERIDPVLPFPCLIR